MKMKEFGTRGRVSLAPPRSATALGPISFIFMPFLAKILPNNSFSPSSGVGALYQSGKSSTVLDLTFTTEKMYLYCVLRYTVCKILLSHVSKLNLRNNVDNYEIFISQNEISQLFGTKLLKCSLKKKLI